jgi:hypothetical protein
MSIKVSLACEDHTLDQYVVRPVIKALLTNLGRPNARIHVITNPRIRGFENLKAQACSILETYGPISALVIFVIDADGQDGLDGRPDRKQQFLNSLSVCPNNDKALVVVARQELEVWALWGSRSRIDVQWADVVQERDPKERFFDSLVTSLDRKVPGYGRQRLIAASLRGGWPSLCSGCPEIRQLEHEVREKLGL